MKKISVIAIAALLYCANLYAFDIRGVVASCEFRYQQISPQEHKLTCETLFKMGNYCPPIAGYNYEKKSDTLFVKLYYDLRRERAFVEGFCRSVNDTIIRESLSDVSYINYSMGVVKVNNANHSLTDTFLWNRDSTFALRSSSVEEMNWQERTRIYPNPSDGTLTIQSDNAGENLSVQLFSITGIPILKEKEKFNPGETKLQLDLHHISAGIYWMKLYADERIISTQKFLKLN